MQKPCQDSYYTLFSSYPMLLDYHEEQAKNSRWIRCKVADLQVEPLGESSPLIGNLSAFAAGTSQEAVKDTAENLGLASSIRFARVRERTYSCSRSRLSYKIGAMYSRILKLAPISAAIPEQRSISESGIVPLTTVSSTRGTYFEISRANFSTPMKASSPNFGWHSFMYVSESAAFRLMETQSTRPLNAGAVSSFRIIDA